MGKWAIYRLSTILLFIFSALGVTVKLLFPVSLTAKVIALILCLIGCAIWITPFVLEFTDRFDN